MAARARSVPTLLVGLTNSIRGRRPDSASLVDRGVLKADPRTNMSVVVAQTRLNKELVKQIIKRMLLSRPGNKKAGVPAC